MEWDLDYSMDILTILIQFMFRNYIISSIRNLVRHRTVSLLNLLGLSLGIAACVIIFLYVRMETSYDRFHPEHERIFRVEKISNIYNEVEKIASIPVFIGDEIAGYEEIEHIGRIGPWRSNVVRCGTEAHKEDGIFSATPGLFNILDVQILEGDPLSGLSRPMTIVLTESIARRYFGKKKATGELLQVDTSWFEVVAVIGDFPRNTHVRMNLIFSEKSLETLVDFPAEVSAGRHCPTYVKLHEWADPGKFEDRIRKLAHELNPELYEKRGEDMECFLRPIADIHLNANQLKWDTDPGGEPLLPLPGLGGRRPDHANDQLQFHEPVHRPVYHPQPGGGYPENSRGQPQ